MVQCINVKLGNIDHIAPVPPPWAGAKRAALGPVATVQYQERHCRSIRRAGRCRVSSASLRAAQHTE